MTGFLEHRKGVSLTALALVGAAAAALVLVGFAGGHGLADSLRAAGLNGTAPPNAGAFKSFIDQMTQNALWTTDTAGRYKGHYRFKNSTVPKAQYRFRAVVKEQSGYPFARGISNTAKVIVRG